MRTIDLTKVGLFRDARRALVLALCLGASAVASHAELQPVSIAASAGSLRVRPDVFVAGFSAPAWTGDLVSRRASASTSDASFSWSAAAQLDARSDMEMNSRRMVLTSDVALGGVPFQWTALSLRQKAILAPHEVGEDQFDYIRGDRRRQIGAPNGTFRARTSRLGDIVNSNVWYVGRMASQNASGAPHTSPPQRTAMVYVGANDGMLHGFSTSDGSEQLAYVPQALLPSLGLLTAPDYQHRSYVDGPVFSGDAPVGQSGEMKTLLVGSLGAGGKGYFVLDISAPEQFVTGNAAALVRTDTTTTADADIGQIYGTPVTDEADANLSRQIVRMNNRRWAAVMGNGYFSESGRPVLLIQYLDDANRDKTNGAREWIKLSPCPSTGACRFQGGNGLSAPRLIDVNGDGMVDLAYAGDLQGNLWKFDLSGTNAAGNPESAWRVAFDNQPFFVARNAQGAQQSITTAPYWMPHPRGGVMIAFGTGRSLQKEDATSRGTDTLYALHDDSKMVVRDGAVQLADTTPVNTAAQTEARPSTLVRQEYTSTFRSDGVDYQASSARPVAYDGSERKRGWYLDLPLPGQRVLHHPRGFEGQKFLVQSTVPRSDATETKDAKVTPWTAGTSYLSVLNMFTGAPSATPPFALADGTLGAPGLSMARVESGSFWRFRENGGTRLTFPNRRSIALRDTSVMGLRAGWREY